jgi:hypothetical protein
MRDNKLYPRKLDSVEREMVANIDLKNSILELADTILPILKGDAKAGDVNKMLERFAPAAVLSLWNEMLHGKGEKTRLEAAKTLSFMAGYKPVEKTVSVEGNLDKMSEKQIDAFLMNALKGMSNEERGQILEMVKSPGEETWTVDVDSLKKEGI